jgi:hypothetical protein
MARSQSRNGSRHSLAPAPRSPRLRVAASGVVHRFWSAASAPLRVTADAGAGRSVRVALEEVLEVGEGVFGLALVASVGVEAVDDVAEHPAGKVVLDLEVEAAPGGGGGDLLAPPGDQVVRHVQRRAPEGALRRGDRGEALTQLA